MIGNLSSTYGSGPDWIIAGLAPRSAVDGPTKKPVPQCSNTPSGVPLIIGKTASSPPGRNWNVCREAARERSRVGWSFSASSVATGRFLTSLRFCCAANVVTTSEARDPGGAIDKAAQITHSRRLLPKPLEVNCRSYPEVLSALTAFVRDSARAPNETVKVQLFLGLVAELFPKSGVVAALAKGAEKTVRVQIEGEERLRRTDTTMATP